MKENAVESDSHNHIYLKSHEEKQISEGENQNGKKILPMHTTEIHYFQFYVPSQEKRTDFVFQPKDIILKVGGRNLCPPNALNLPSLVISHIV